MRAKDVVAGVAALALAGSALGACKNDDACAVGAEGCACTPGGSCDPGLTCLSALCVDTSKEGVDSGGEQTDGGAPGTDATAPELPGCTTNGECAADEVCAFSGPTAVAGHCLKGSGKPCQPDGLCIHGQAFDTPGFGGAKDDLGGTGGACSSGGCVPVEGHLQGACVDADGTGVTRTCVPLCQYHDDLARMACAKDPRFGISEACARNHARLFAAVGLAVFCAGDRVIGGQCRAPTAAFSDDLEWTVACLLGHIAKQTASCATIALSDTGCFFNAQFQPAGRLDAKGFIEAVDQHLQFFYEPGGGTGGPNGDPSQQCGTDCDCGRCWYCDKDGSNAVCRYGGEGPYGCYRGCPWT